MDKSLVTLRVGVFVPSDPPTAGGAYEFQQTIFAEILKRKELSSSTDIKFIIISLNSKTTDAWGLNGEEVFHIKGARGWDKIKLIALRIIKKLTHPGKSLKWDETSYGKKIIEQLNKKVDVLWSLSPSIITDQLPFILPIWDLQHRLQPFFPEVSRSGEWEVREDYFSNTSRKAFLNLVGTARGSKELQLFFGIDQERIIVNPFPCPPAVRITESQVLKILNEHQIQADKYLFYPAQFWSHKNHLGLLHAFDQLLHNGNDLQLVLTGSEKGVLNKIQSKISDLGLENKVINLGFVSREVIGSLYSRAFALVYPSFFGPDNIPPLEAMSYGTPAIVADVPGSTEQYGDSVLRFNPNSPIEIAECVDQLSKDSALRKKLVNLGFELVRELTTSKYVNRVEDELRRQKIALKCANL